MAISIDRISLAELMVAIDDKSKHAAPLGMMSTMMDERLAGTVLRLLEALSSPMEARVLGPGIVREICYRVLMGEQGGAMRAALTSQSHFGKVARALRRIHADYAGDLDVAMLAGEANMSVPAFHVHFKSVTQCSPIQYVKSTRLHQARLLMIRNGMTASVACAQVGYESASQFSREFKRLFGRTPGEEAVFMKQSLVLMPAERGFAKLPDFAGQANGGQVSLSDVFTIPGVRPILFVVLTFVLAHNILYTYIAPFLASARMHERTGLVLLIFGAASLLGIWAIGVMIDRHLRMLTLASTCLFALAAIGLHLASHDPAAIYGAVAIWGLGFGGAATLFQTALAQAANDAPDVAQSMLVTVWNLAIAGGGVIGGLLLDQFGAGMFAPALLVLLLAAFVMIWFARHRGFPTSTA